MLNARAASLTYVISLFPVALLRILENLKLRSAFIAVIGEKATMEATGGW
jgi:hypothetical protein